MADTYQVVNNEKNLHFEIHLPDGEVAYIEYQWYKGDMAFMHTVVPVSAEGKGVGSALAKYALEYVKEKKIPIMVYCPFVAGYIKKHPEYAMLMDKQYLG